MSSDSVLVRDQSTGLASSSPQGLRPGHRERVYRLACAAFLGLAALQMIWLATHLKVGLIPDESWHISTGFLWRWTPDLHLLDGPETATLGPLSTRNYLAAMLARGASTVGTSVGLNAVLAMRLLNVLYSVLSLWVAMRLFDELLGSRVVRFSCLVAQGSLAMFLFLGSGVSYDNLANLLGWSGVLCFVRWRTKPSLSILLWMAVWLGLASLVKFSLIPLALLLALALILTLQDESFRRTALAAIRAPDGSTAWRIGILLLVILGLNAFHYGRNLVAYSAINPDCQEVLGSEVCESQGLFRRSKLQRQNAVEPDGLSSYLVRYFTVMPQGLLGISSFQTLFKSGLENGPYLLIAILSMGGLLRRHHLPPGWIWTLPMIGGYVALHAYIGYQTHRASGVYIALAGRYWLPIIPLVLGWMGCGLEAWSKTIRTWFGGMAAFVFFLGGFPWLVLAADPTWFGFENYETVAEIQGIRTQLAQEMTVYDPAPGRTGLWWCENHFGANLGGSWICLGADSLSCRQTLPLGSVILCAPEYSRRSKRTTVAIGADLQQGTGQDWCDYSLSAGSYRYWKCLSDSSCSEVLSPPSSVECQLEKLAPRDIAATRSIVVNDEKPGQTGEWWCEQHFGHNLEGQWVCIDEDSGSCAEDAALGDEVSCGVLF